MGVDSAVDHVLAEPAMFPAIVACAFHVRKLGDGGRV